MKRVPVLIVLAAALGACGGDGGDGNPVQQAAEVEPNGDFASSQVLGPISPGRGFVVNGRASFNDDPADDEFDSFLVVADGDQVLQVTLTHAPEADFDLAFVDPANGDILTEGCDGTTSPETCTFQLMDGQMVNIEVEAFSFIGTLDYTLEIISVAL